MIRLLISHSKDARLNGEVHLGFNEMLFGQAQSCDFFSPYLTPFRLDIESNHLLLSSTQINGVLWKKKKVTLPITLQVNDEVVLPFLTFTVLGFAKTPHFCRPNLKELLQQRIDSDKNSDNKWEDFFSRYQVLVKQSVEAATSPQSAGKQSINEDT